MTKNRISAFGILLIIIGIGMFAFTLARLIRGAALDSQTKVPGRVTAEIDAPGRHYLWDNHWTTFEGERFKYPADCPHDAKVSVSDANGAEIAFIPDSSQNWSIGNNEKTSIGYIEVPSASTILLEIDDIGRDRIVTVSNRTLKQELWSRLGGFGISLVAGTLGVLIYLVNAFARRRSSSRATKVG